MRSVVQLYPGPPLYRGAVAQLGERLVCNQEATGSIPVSSTRKLAEALCEVGRFDHRFGWVAGSDCGHHRWRCDCHRHDGPEASGADREDRARYRSGCRAAEELEEMKASLMLGVNKIDVEHWVGGNLEFARLWIE